MFRTAIIISFLVLLTAVGCAQDNQKTGPEIQTQVKIEKASDHFAWKSLSDAMQLAKENQKKVLVYANASWCTYCKKMEKEVFTKDDIQKLTSDYFYPVWIDIESEDSLTFRGRKMTEMIFSRSLRVTGTPTFIFFDEEGDIISGQPGYIPQDVYAQILRYVGTDAYEDQSFQEFTVN